VSKRLFSAELTGAVAMPLTRLQRTVARRMTAARAETPDFAAEVDVDMSAVAALRAALRREERFVPSYNDYVVKACALALRAVPQLNASYADDEVVRHARVNVGVAVATDGGLVVPTVPDADRLSVEEISRAIAALAAKVRDGSIAPAELAGGTFTVSNLGMHGVRRFTAIVNPPQAGILAVGAVQERVVAREGRPQVGLRMLVTLSADHRIVYGADAAAFLAACRSALEDPGALDAA